MNMKGKSIIEVLLVFMVFRLVSWAFRITDFAEKEQDILGWSYVAGVLLVLAPIGILLVTRRRFESYGFTLANWRRNLDIGLTYALVAGVIVNGVGFMSLWIFGMSYTGMTGALILACCEIVVLFLILSILRRRERRYDPENPPNPVPNFLVLIVLLLLPVLVGVYVHRLTLIVVSTVVWQFFFSGFGEEIMYRGYYQSRINEEFGRPFSFLGVNFGYGVIISSLLFALAHVLNPFSPLEGNYELAWWWGLFTFFGGLTFGLVREKTGSIIPCGIAHGLPDAVGEAFALMFHLS
ncbi:MAG: CPBP family intramembrane metalloprotease [Theionarchaea archaeon]|nr:CPBP family intramembrane metalloprotease [Theionarchaea archaeon]